MIPPVFWNFSDAVADLINCGISGPVNFIAASNTYDEQLTITTIPGASSINTVTFESATGDSTDVTISYGASSETDNWVVRFDSADYLVFKHMSFLVFFRHCTPY